MVTSLALAAVWAISAARVGQTPAPRPPLTPSFNAAFADLAVKPIGPAASKAAAPVAQPDDGAQSVFRSGDSRELSVQATSPAVIDSRTLAIGALRFQLEGVELEDETELCKLPSGQFTSCAERARTQLELQVRWRTLNCRYRLHAPTLALGSCRAGDADLAERLRAARPTWRIRADVADVIKTLRNDGHAARLDDQADPTRRAATTRMDLLAAPVPAQAFVR